jgi:hypothetical protein
LVLTPLFQSKIQSYAETLGPIENGMPTPEGFEDPTVMMPEVGLPPTCARVPTVMLQKGTFFYNSSVWIHLSGAQQAIFQVEAEFEQFTVWSDAGTFPSGCDPSTGPGCNPIDPSRASLLMVMLLARPMTEQDLVNELLAYGFGEFNTATQVQAAKSYLLGKYPGMGSDLAVITSFCQSNRGSEKQALAAFLDLQSVEGTLSNFPDPTEDPNHWPILPPFDQLAFPVLDYALNSSANSRQSYACPNPSSQIDTANSEYARDLALLQSL